MMQPLLGMKRYDNRLSLSRFLFKMSNSSAMAPAATPLTGNVNENSVFEMPDKGVGDDRRAICARHNPLYRVGSLARDTFDLNHQMTIEIRFKIYTGKEVNVGPSSQGTPKVGAGKKAAKVAKLKCIESKSVNPGYLEIKRCFFGKSLNDFKRLVADSCDDYESGMRLIILNPDLSPTLKWKTTVGRIKHVLTDGDKWQAFVDALSKSTKKFGILMIDNENVEVKAKEDDKESATKKLIAETNGEAVEDKQSEESKKDSELQAIACKVFSQHGLEGYAGGDGTILTTPWDPTFRYRLTFPAAWIWAKGVIANIASIYIPPNTAEFRNEIKKTQWIHPEMSVEHRVKTRFQGHPRGSHGFGGHEGGSHLAGPSEVGGVGFQQGSNTTGEKRSGQDVDELEDVKPVIKKIKTEDQPGDSFNDPITLSSDSESQMNEKTSTSSQAVDLEKFLIDCDIPPDDSRTRLLLTEAGIESWTDLIPSLQTTESTLTSCGIDRQVANRLMEEAQLRYWDSNLNVQCPTTEDE
ncbi:hypothetical protein DFH28DRAFT_1223487 [Melampsora americana]|nr:hypothetical protein DFH28DRAFT_1223487 [Melampsora americana]